MASTRSILEHWHSDLVAPGTCLALPLTPPLALVLSKRGGLNAWLILHRVHHVVASHRILVLLAATALTMMVLASFRLLSQMTVVKARVHNLSHPFPLHQRKAPGFHDQNRKSESLAAFRSHLEDILKVEYPDSLAKAVAIRRWVRSQQSQDRQVWSLARVNHENPERLLEEQKAGVPGACRRFAYILLGALLSAGFDARVVGFANGIRRRGLKRHASVEVWIDELNQWVLLDPTYDTLVLVDGKPASAIGLYETVRAGDLSRISFQRNGSTLHPQPTLAAFEKYCRHLFVATSNAVFDGYAVRIWGPKRISFLHYSQGITYPEVRKQVLLGVSSTGFMLASICWTWSLVSLVAE